MPLIHYDYESLFCEYQRRIVSCCITMNTHALSFLGACFKREMIQRQFPRESLAACDECKVVFVMPSKSECIF